MLDPLHPHAPFAQRLFGRTTQRIPTIKGLFVNSHVATLQRRMGNAAVEELARRFGGPVHFGAFESVPLRSEMELLEHSMDIMQPGAWSGSAHRAEAGRLHFRNFCDTPLGSALMRSLPHTPGSFRTLLHNTPSIARIVFDGLIFESVDVHEGMTLTVINCDYSPEHFRGFFEEWMHQWGITGSVRARTLSEGVCEYRLSF